MSLDTTLAAMGVKLLLVPDVERLAAMRPRYTARGRFGRKPTSGGILAQKKTLLRDNPALAAYYAYRRAAMQTPWRRRQIARKAIRIRWQRAKAAAPAL
jgi:hypothetical protein